MQVRFLKLLILASLTLTALVAIVTLLFGSFDELAGRILGTSISIAVCGLLALAGAVSLREEAPQPVRAAGALIVGLSILGFVAFLILIWSEGRRHENLSKFFGVTTVSAFALTLVVLLERIKLPAGKQWMFVATASMILTLAVLLDVPLILMEKDIEALGRLIGVVSVLATFGALAMPVVAWQSARERRSVAVRPEKGGGIALLCPGCARDLQLEEGRSHCPGCGQGIEITLFRDED